MFLLHDILKRRVNGVGIPFCDICGKPISVPFKAIVGGPILDVCKKCLKYGERLEITEIDKIMVRSDIFGSYFIEKKTKGE